MHLTHKIEFVRGALLAGHGASLQGLGNVPAIAGHSPSYLARQLYDRQSGARRGVAPMQAGVARLSVADGRAMTAYAASLDP
jgi:cytochrome c553